MAEEWKDMKSLLSRVALALGVRTALVDVVRSAIESCINVPIARESVRIKGKIAYIQAHPAVRNEIFLKKEKILLKINELEVGTLSDIR